MQLTALRLSALLGTEVMMKPLFVPLKTEYYEAFANGRKTEELRRYGPRWNERTCAAGRDVVLSKGYGKQHRMAGRVWKFKKQHGSLFGSTYKSAILAVFGTLDIEIACVSIDLAQHGMRTESIVPNATEFSGRGR